MKTAIRFSHVTKTFSHHGGQMLLRERIRHALQGANKRFRALNDISFELPAGESMGLIGSNGAGKSTILNLATGLAVPDSGTVEVNGRVAALLELGAGFHQDLTGGENVLINAALMGLSRREAKEKFDEIVEFSGVGEFINEPLRTYSSGMNIRLAFSVAIAVSPDVLVVDEVLGVGDENFYRRSFEKICEFQRQGKSILLASHNAELIRTFCHRALWIEHGSIMATGEASEVIETYRGSVPAARGAR
jgi:ABC-type polysaccharide/polyol phosphate transport system ATPase subunit